MLYKTQGKYEEAEPLWQRTLMINEQQLGVSHPNTAISLNNLATLYDSQGRYEKAEPLCQRALAIYEQEAKLLSQCALAIFKQTLKSEHLHIQRLQKDYTALLEAMNGEEETDS